MMTAPTGLEFLEGGREERREGGKEGMREGGREGEREGGRLQAVCDCATYNAF